VDVAGKAALDPVELSDRAVRGFRLVELHLTSRTARMSPGQARELVGASGLEVCSVHAPPGVSLGASPGACGTEEVVLAVRVADAVMPPGVPRRVVVHLGPDLPLGTPFGVWRFARAWAVRQAACDLAAVARSVRPRGGPLAVCVENHVWCWLDGRKVFPPAGRLPEDFAVLAQLAAEAGVGENLGFCLDVCHALSACAATGGVVGFGDFVREMGPRLSLVHFSGVRGLGACRADHGLPLGERDAGVARSVLRALARAGFSGPVVAEVLEPDSRFAPGMEATARFLESLVRAAAP
jgi:sugar phosphate isomerase/epimerase